MYMYMLNMLNEHILLHFDWSNDPVTSNLPQTVAGNDVGRNWWKKHVR